MTNSPVAETLSKLVTDKLEEATTMVNFKFASVVHDITNQTVQKLGLVPGYPNQELVKIVNTSVLTAMAAKCSSAGGIQTWLNRYAGAENLGVGASGTMEFHPVMLSKVFRNLGNQTALPLGAYVEQNPGGIKAKDMYATPVLFLALKNRWGINRPPNSNLKELGYPIQPTYFLFFSKASNAANG